MTTYDIIGDIHGCAPELEGLLSRLGYEQTDGAYRRAGHQVIFVGDLIDRGDSQVEVVRIVRAMHEAGSAQVIMGNHEFNAISYATRNPADPDDFMRTHLGRKGGHNTHQHRHFLEQVTEDSPLHHEIIAWFRTLPLYLELGDLRIAHACWHPDSLAVLDSWVPPGTPVSDAFIIEANSVGTPAFTAVEVVLKGPEMELSEEQAWRDPEGSPRRSARIKWWDDSAITMRQIAMIPQSALTPDDEPHPGLPDLPYEEADAYRYRDAVPVFFGHYWFNETPTVSAVNAVCVDYSAVRPGGSLVAYRWTGPGPLDDSGFIAFPSTSRDVDDHLAADLPT